VVTALSYLLPGIVVDETISNRLVQLLQATSLRLQQVTLGVIADIAALSADGTTQLIKSGMIPILRGIYIYRNAIMLLSIKLSIIDVVMQYDDRIINTVHH
jgi:hypothetical protein